MKNLLIITTLLLGTINPAFAKTKAKKDPLNDFKSRFQSSAFSNVELSKQQELELSATDLYRSSTPEQKKASVNEALKGWQETEIEKKDQLASVVWSGGGELWSVQNNKITKVGEWSDSQLHFSQTTPPHGRLFAFFGGQMVQGGVADVTGFNARIGSTLFKNRYDLAVSLSYASIKTTPSVNTNSLGVVGRALFPLSERVGYNLGGQLVRTEIDSTPTTTPGAVAGLNFFIPTGSFDVTVSTLDAGRWSLLAGYTLFFNNQ
ncbi:MAG: hypothetical protein AABY53_08595 [Bdellovibrionota bacterium]